MALKISRSQVSTQPMDGPNPWPTLRLITCCGHTVSTAIPTHSLTLSPFNGHIPGGPGLADTRMSPFWILLELRTMEVVSGDNWSYKTCRTITLSPFNGHIPGGPGLADTRMSPFWILLELRMMEVGSGDNWSYKTCRTPVKSSSPTNQHPVFYWPSCGPPVSVWIRVHDVPLWTIKSEAIDPAAG